MNVTGSLESRTCDEIANPVSGCRFTYGARILFTAIFLSWFTLSPALALDKPGVESCTEFLNDLEQTVDACGVRDTASIPVPGHPLLRTTRFLDGMKYFITGQAEGEQWFDLLYQQGSIAVSKEIDNLPDAALAPLMYGRQRTTGAGMPSPHDLRESLKIGARECAQGLLDHTKKNIRWSMLALGQQKIPSEYRTATRVMGLYPLFTLPISAGIVHYKSKVSKQYAIPMDLLKAQGTLTSFSPMVPQRPDTEGASVAALLARISQNPLDIPLLSEGELKWISEYYAPILEQDVTGSYDLPGMVIWQGPLITVDTETPAVYYYATYAILRGRPLLQLNYVIWYTQRPRTGLLDIEAGRIHGMTLRITILPTGEPAMADVIHNCGCYHFFFPSEKIFREPKTALFREDAFVPQWLPPYDPASRFAVRIGTQRHWVERLHHARSPSPNQAAYELIPYDTLESLPHPSGEKESIFTPEGIVKGETERPERFILFAPGIPKIGSMRQRGHHATALLGERTFDDPRLFEEFFFLY
ncbi:MAG: hypothetical protein AABY87_08250 [bacterium]